MAAFDKSMTFNANLLPKTHETGDLGTSTQKWDNLYTKSLFGSLGRNYITITVNGDANTYYPVVIGSPASYYPGQFVSITRGFSDPAPDTWNTATHRGGLTLTLYWNGSKYQDGNTAGADCFVFDIQQTYSTMVAKLGNSTAGKVVWLRGGGAAYRIFSMQGTQLSTTIYYETYTDIANQTFSPTTTPETITRYMPLNVAGADTLDGAHLTQIAAAKATTLAWGTQSTIATIGGNAIKVTLPANPNTNTAHTTFAWTNGTTAGPTGSLSGNHTAVSFGAIPSASGSISGIVTTGTQTFAGEKTFSSANGFTYSGIGVATDNTYRPIWFAYNGQNGRPVYDTDFTYNPSSNAMKVGQIYYTGGTANRLAWADGDQLIHTGYHYANSTKVAINTTNEPPNNFYVNGTSRFNGATTFNSTVYFANGTKYLVNAAGNATFNTSLTLSPPSGADAYFRWYGNAGTSSLAATSTRTYTVPQDGVYGALYYYAPMLTSTYAVAGDDTSTKTTTVLNNGFFEFREYSTSSTDATLTGYYECYRLPIVTKDITANKIYTILTTRNAVTVAQGGTGATSFTANSVIMSGSSTTAALTTRAVTNNTSVTALTTASTNIPTVNTVMNAGTSANTANTFVKRDNNGNFTAGTITAALNGNASSATKANITTTTNAIAKYSDQVGTFANTTILINMVDGKEHIVMTTEGCFKAYQPRNTAGNGDWAQHPFQVLDSSNSDFAHFGVYGTSNTLNWIFIGTNSYNSTNNLRIDVNGCIRTPRVGINTNVNGSYVLTAEGNGYIKANAAATNSVGFQLENGKLAVTNYTNTLTIGSYNANWIHFVSATSTSGASAPPFHFSTAVHVNGNMMPYGTTNTRNLGSADARWKALYIGTADSYGGASTAPIYWNGGVPTAVSDISLIATDTSSKRVEVGNTNGKVELLASTNRGVYDSTNSKWIVYTNTAATNTYIPLWASKGSATKGVYFNSSGEPVAMTYSLSATVNSGTQWGVAYYSGANAISGTAAGTSGQVLQSGGSAAPSWITATSSNTASTIVKRDASGNFSANTITANLSGTATNATNIYSSKSTNKAYVLGTTTASSANHATVYNESVYTSGSVLYGAAWNDYAEYRMAVENYEAGTVVIETKNGLTKSAKRLQAGAAVISDTFGFVIGETENAKTPIAVSGRVLVYTDRSIQNFKPGDPVCTGKNGTVSKMNRLECILFPDRILGIVSEIPEYEYWGAENIKVNNRIWIKVK